MVILKLGLSIGHASHLFVWLFIIGLGIMQVEHLRLFYAQRGVLWGYDSHVFNVEFHKGKGNVHCEQESDVWFQYGNNSGHYSQFCVDGFHNGF